MTISVKDALDSLTPEAKRRLIYALNAGISLVEPDGKGGFVAVHTNASDPRVEITATAGGWSCGKMRGKRS